MRRIERLVTGAASEARPPVQWGMASSPRRFARALIAIAFGLASAGCATNGRGSQTYVYAPDAFVEELRRRVPDLPERLAEPPHVLDAEIIARAEARMLEAPIGPARVQAMVDFLSEPRPEGLGLVYDWAATGGARATLEIGRGNCVSLAAVLVALGRGVGWPIYFAEARTRRPETKEFEAVTALSDHMVVIVAARSFQAVVDFTGLLEQVEDIRPIDDLKAYAHIVNNVSAQRVMLAGSGATPPDWERAVAGFELATRIEPSLGRAWNNLGLALTRLGRFAEARTAYRRAVELDTAFGSAERNLVTLETRASGAPSIKARTGPPVAAPSSRPSSEP